MSICRDRMTWCTALRVILVRWTLCGTRGGTDGIAAHATRRSVSRHRNQRISDVLACEGPSPDGWPAAVAGAVWVFHAASPQAAPTETDRTDGWVAAVGGIEKPLLW